MAMVPIAAGHRTGKSQKSVVDLLRERHAMRREAAQPLPNLSTGQRRRVNQLVERGVVRVAAKDRYYIDEDTLREWHARQRAIAFVLSVVAAGIGAAWLLLTP